MSHQTKDKGDLAVLMALADLRRHGIIAFLPISEHLPFDMVAVMPDMTILLRLQVKYRKTNGYGGIELLFRSNYYDSKKIYSKPINLSEIDGFAIYNPETDAISAIISDKAKSITLRVRPSANNQKHGVWLADDFRNLYDMMPLSGDKLSNLPMKCNSLNDELATNLVIVDLMRQGIQSLLPYSSYIPFSRGLRRYENTDSLPYRHG